jgi:hypothetical protein
MGSQNAALLQVHGMPGASARTEQEVKAFDERVSFLQKEIRRLGAELLQMVAPTDAELEEFGWRDLEGEVNLPSDDFTALWIYEERKECRAVAPAKEKK